MATIWVIKKGGRKQRFERGKISRSCRKAGAGPRVFRIVANHVAKKVKNGMKTVRIKKIVVAKLNKYDKEAAKKYKSGKRRRR